MISAGGGEMYLLGFERGVELSAGHRPHARAALLPVQLFSLRCKFIQLL